MSYVGDPFQYDIFISYSWGAIPDDHFPALRQWSLGFAHELARELQFFSYQFGGNTLGVFVDRDQKSGRGLDQMESLTGQLRTNVQASAILTVLMTPYFLRSRWCRQELDWWIAGQSSHALDPGGRIAVARVATTGLEEWPAALCDSSGEPLLGQLFYDPKTVETRPQPFSFPHVTTETMGTFRECLHEFVGAIVSRLRKIRDELKERQKREDELKRLHAQTGQVVYLHGRNVHAREWERVKRELDDENYAVLPFEPEPVESDPVKIKQARAERLRTMIGCDAILVLGTADAKALQADLSFIGRSERQLAMAQSGRLLPCGVVDTAGLVRQNPSWKRIAQNAGINWFDASLSPWTPQIRPWLNGTTD